MTSISNRNNRGIMQYWPTIVGLISFVFAVGVFVNKTDSANQAVKEVNARLDRQFETMNGISLRVTVVEKEAAYQKGLHERIEHNEKLPNDPIR